MVSLSLSLILIYYDFVMDLYPIEDDGCLLSLQYYWMLLLYSLVVVVVAAVVVDGNNTTVVGIAIVGSSVVAVAVVIRSSWRQRWYCLRRI